MHQLLAKFAVFCTVTMLCGSSHAQMVKCKDGSGKVTYAQGSKCPVGFSTASVNLSGGNISAPRSQEELDREQARWRGQARANTLANPPIECRFADSPFTHQSDEYRKQLIAAATRECVKNVIAAEEGRPQSFLALDRYKAVFETPRNSSTIIYQRSAPVMQMPQLR
jgi:hypothetical protein